MDLCPWADVVYGCDAAWWRYRKGLPEFTGLKIRYGGEKLPEHPDIRTIQIPNPRYDRFLFDETGTVGAGGNSGFQALNLAAQFGSRRIVLIGFDMHSRGGVHWYGRNRWTRANNPDQSNFDRWMAAFKTASDQLQSMGVEVLNANPGSAMQCFPRVKLEAVWPE